MLRARTVRRSPHEWNVLEGGHTGAPMILFLHGAGANSESFAAAMELLCTEFQVIAPDLPGHGRTRMGAGNRSSLESMSVDITALVEAEYGTPCLVVGHSAGGAIAVRLSDSLSPRGQVLINPALTPFSGAAGWAFPLLAKGLLATPFAADVITGLVGRPQRISALLEATGSEISQEIFERYLSLARNTQHIRGTLKMMAAWDVRGIADSVAHIRQNTLCILGERDGTVPAPEARKTLASIPEENLKILSGGHLLHEERCGDVARLIQNFAKAI